MALRLLTILLSLLAVFQLLLILGLPLGNAAWGGQHEVLPTNLRIGSAVAIIIYAFVIWVARKRIQQPESRFARIAMWIITIYFGVGVLLNIASSSPWERYVMSVVALALAVCGVVISRSSHKQKQASG